MNSDNLDFPADAYERKLNEAMEEIVGDVGSYAEWLQFRRALERWMASQELGFDQGWEEREWERRVA